MKAGRIETYIHSDSSTPNKAGAMVRVCCKTDFAARTPQFIAFAQTVARFALGANAGTWSVVAETFPELEQERQKLSKKLKEEVVVDQIVILSLLDVQGGRC